MLNPLRVIIAIISCFLHKGRCTVDTLLLSFGIFSQQLIHVNCRGYGAREKLAHIR